MSDDILYTLSYPISTTGSTSLMGDLIDITVESLLNYVETRRPINQISNSINMVPSGLRDLSPSSFNPRVVSIGPLHREDENLKAFECQKATYMHDLLTPLNSNMKELLTLCVLRVADLLGTIRGSYARSIPYNDSELAQMMVVDASFILQVGHTLPTDKTKYSFISPSIVYDLFLVENQIPFFILETIFECTLLSYAPGVSLTTYILKLVNSVNVFDTNITVGERYPFFYDHILGFMEKCYWAPDHIRISPGLPSSKIHSTVELDRAGVIFKPNQDEIWQMAMEFNTSTLSCCSWSWGKPTLRMPVLRIHSFTELILRNLIAYEYSSASPGFVTSNATAMDMLVNTQDDISILMESKVVVNHLGSNDKAAKMINSLCKELPLLSFYYVDQWKQLDTHYNGYWPRVIASLKRAYPWTIIGIILFALTVSQTIAAF